MKNQTNAMQTKQKLGVGVSFWCTQMGLVWGWGSFFGGAAYLPQMKKTLDWRFACSSLTMYGVEYAWTREVRCFVFVFFFPVTNGEVDGSKYLQLQS